MQLCTSSHIGSGVFLALVRCPLAYWDLRGSIGGAWLEAVPRWLLIPVYVVPAGAPECLWRAVEQGHPQARAAEAELRNSSDLPSCIKLDRIWTFEPMTDLKLAFSPNPQRCPQR